MKTTLYTEALATIENIEQSEVDDIYALSFYIELAEVLPAITIGYNTNEQVKKSTPEASCLAEAKWNYAFWLQNRLCVFGEEGKYSSDASIQAMQSEFTLEMDGYNTANKQEDWHVCDENAQKITDRTWANAAEVAAELHQSTLFKDKFGRQLPILVHELEYHQKIIDINKIANPDGQANEFFAEFMNF